MKKNRVRAREAERRYRATPNGKRYHCIYVKRKTREYRNTVIKCLGGICEKCGFADGRALQIDHVYGGGKQHRAKINNSLSYYKNILLSVLADEELYQLLCANCNWIKRVELDECPAPHHPEDRAGKLNT